MLYSNVKDFNAADYAVLAKAFALLKSRDFTQEDDGRILVDEDTYIQVLSYQTQDIRQVPFERHHERLDIHYIAEGREIIAVSADSQIEPASPYNAERDIEFLEEPKHINHIILEKGDFLLIGMDEPHKTNGWIEEGHPENVKKIVLKVRRSADS
ncbi:YhcH/YjgK/YiaL family protein [Streptococcus dentiloxodontae]